MTQAKKRPGSWAPRFQLRPFDFKSSESTLNSRGRRALFECRKPKPTKSKKSIATKLKYNKEPTRIQGKTSKLPKARERDGEQVAVGFTPASDWLKGWPNHRVK